MPNDVFKVVLLTLYLFYTTVQLWRVAGAYAKMEKRVAKNEKHIMELEQRLDALTGKPTSSDALRRPPTINPIKPIDPGGNGQAKKLEAASRFE